MAKKFLTGLNLVVLDADPATGSEGELYFNSSASVAKIYQAGSWSVLGAGGGGTTVSTTEPPSPEIGDSWYKNDTGEFYVYDGTYWVEVNGVVSLTQEQVQDYISPLFIHSNHTNISATYDDLNNQMLLSASPGYTNEEAVDAVALALTSGSNSNVIVSYDDINNTINLNTSGSIVNIDSIVYPDFITFDTSPEIIPTEQGSIYWDSGDLGFRIVADSTTLLIGQEQYASVKNSTGSNISKGKVVYINGAQGQKPTIALADADTEITSSKTFGFTAEDIIAGAEGLVVTEGILRGINTLEFTEGGEIYLSGTAGGFTQTKPTAPVNLVFLGYVVKAHASSGEVYVKIQNGYELEELHDVLISASVQNNELLTYNSASSLWINQTAGEAGILTESLAASTYLTQANASTVYATKVYADTAASSASAAAVSYLVDSAPATLDTLNELAAALGDDANFASTVATSLGNKLDISTASATYLTQATASTTYSLVSHNHTLDSLSNVEISGLVDGDAIVWSSASSAWINKVAEGGATTTVSETPPATASLGDTWYRQSDGSFFIYDGTYWVEVTSIITMTDEEAQDKVSSLFVHSNHSNLTATYDDANNQIILATSASVSSEQVQDLIAPLFTHANHTNIIATYDDGNNQILLSASGGYTNQEAIDAVVGSGSVALTNGQILASSLTINSVANFDTTTTTISTASATTIDTIPASTYRSAEILVQIVQGSKQTVSKILMIHDGTTANITEYGLIELGASRIPVTISATLTGGNVLIQATITDANSTSATVKALTSAISI